MYNENAHDPSETSAAHPEPQERPLSPDPTDGPSIATDATATPLGASEGHPAADPSLDSPAPPRSCPCSSRLPCPNKVFARGVCRTAHRKLGEAGLPIGEDGRARANASRGLAQLAHRLSSASPERVDDIARRLRPDARERLAEALARAAGRDGMNGKGGR